ncbi:MAG: hypothetical protein R2851_15540 [Caldilineaceae bacterium]
MLRDIFRQVRPLRGTLDAFILDGRQPAPIEEALKSPGHGWGDRL